jgi:hypothetical protein
MYDYDEMLVFPDGAVMLDGRHIGFMPFKYGLPLGLNLRPNDLELLNLWKLTQPIIEGDPRFGAYASSTDVMGQRIHISVIFKFNIDITALQNRKRWSSESAEGRAALKLYRLMELLKKQDIPSSFWPAAFPKEWDLRIIVWEDLDTVARGVELVREFLDANPDLASYLVFRKR